MNSGGGVKEYNCNHLSYIMMQNIVYKHSESKYVENWVYLKAQCAKKKSDKWDYNLSGFILIVLQGMRILSNV